jgi:hypothetical protein
LELSLRDGRVVEARPQDLDELVLNALTRFVYTPRALCFGKPFR